MEMHPTGTTFGSRFAQIAWVVSDIQAAEKFFREVIGVPNFAKMENLRSEDLEGTYYEQSGNYVFHLYMAYSGESLIELIQPVSGQSIFNDYLKKHPYGGVQHIAYTVAEADLDKAISELTNKGYPVITSLNLPVAKVAFFDTSKEIGVVTEIIGLTAAGVEFLQQLKSGVV
jgi:catechol 2,3-dioxygenase-like lactoylglutathione lyase family enzyme